MEGEFVDLGGEENSEGLIQETEMSKSGSVCCLSKQTISYAFESLISCTILLAFIYILLVILGITKAIQLDTLFYTIGYISFVIILSAPIGIYGSQSGSYCALFVYFVIASYHLYALLIYIYFNFIRSSEATSLPKSGYGTLHKIAAGSYTALVAITILAASMKILSNIGLIEPSRVIVVDSNPLD